MFAFSSRRGILFSAVLIISGMLLGSALHTLAPLIVGVQPVSAERVVDELGLKLTIILPKGTLRIGEVLEPHLTLENVGNQTVKLTFVSTTIFVLEVYNGTNAWNETQVYKTSEARLPMMRYETLNPHESISVNYECSQRWGPQLTQGTYYVVGSTDPFGINGEPARLTTPPIEIIVTP